jgi:coenzyme F420-reducing hydrogenase alpha subunit
MTKPTYNELLTLLDACSEAVEEAARREARKGTNEYGLKNITWKLRLERVQEILKAADFEA